MEANVRVINKMAKTMETTVMIEAAMPPKMICATCGSACEGKRVRGTQAENAGKVSSTQDNSAPDVPKARAIVRGRIRNPPRRLYLMCRTHSGKRAFNYLVGLILEHTLPLPWHNRL